MVTLEELEKAPGNMGKSVHRTSTNHTLHKYIVFGRGTRRNILLKEKEVIG